MEEVRFQRQALPLVVRTKCTFPLEAAKGGVYSSVATVLPREQLRLGAGKVFQGATVLFPIFGSLLPIFFGGAFMYLGLTRYVENMKYHNIHISKKRCIVIRKPCPPNRVDFSLQAIVEDPKAVFTYLPNFQK
jgi:hypothetical protein